MRLHLHGVEIFTDGQPAWCETEIVSAGAYVVAVTTVIEQHGVLLTSSSWPTSPGRPLQPT